MEKKIRDDKVVGWNNIVKECKQVQFGDKKFMLVHTLKAEPEQQYFMVDEERLTATAVKYLQAFIEDYSDDEFTADAVSKGIIQLDDDPQIEKLRALVRDLRQECVELAAELTQFRDGVKVDASRLDTLKHEELIEEIEYLS